MPKPHERDRPMTDAFSADLPGGGVSAAGSARVRGGQDEPPLSSDRAGQIVTDLYDRHRVRLIGTALMMVGDRPTAEDVVQDAFAGLYRALPRLADPERALAYVRASVINGCRQVHRARTRAFRLHNRHWLEEPSVWSAESAVLAREESRLALQAVARLPGRAREVLALRYLLDMSDAEIAVTLGVSKATVSSTASRALAALARDLKEQS
jgi:RNA polymerase sigma factor (sigma-70 family)